MESLKSVKKTLKRREGWDKAGKYKYIIDRINALHSDVRADLKVITLTLRYMIMGLEHEFLFDRKYIEDTICKDAIDRELIEELYGTGTGGLLPQEIAKRIEIKGTKRSKPWKVTLHIRRINRRLNQLTGQTALEKKGMGWALTSFMRKAWGTTQEELRKELSWKPEKESVENDTHLP